MQLWLTLKTGVSYLCLMSCLCLMTLSYFKLSSSAVDVVITRIVNQEPLLASACASGNELNSPSHACAILRALKTVFIWNECICFRN